MAYLRSCIFDGFSIVLYWFEQLRASIKSKTLAIKLLMNWHVLLLCVILGEIVFFFVVNFLFCYICHIYLIRLSFLALEVCYFKVNNDGCFRKKRSYKKQSQSKWNNKSTLFKQFYGSYFLFCSRASKPINYPLD